MKVVLHSIVEFLISDNCGTKVLPLTLYPCRDRMERLPFRPVNVRVLVRQDLAASNETDMLSFL